MREEEVRKVLWKARGYQHAHRVAELQALEGDNPYKELFQRKKAQELAWYEAMPYVCAALARHIYHCLKFKDPYDVEKAFRGSSSTPALEQELTDLRVDLDEKFEEMETHLRQIEG